MIMASILGRPSLRLVVQEWQLVVFLWLRSFSDTMTLLSMMGHGKSGVCGLNQKTSFTAKNDWIEVNTQYAQELDINFHND